LTTTTMLCPTNEATVRKAGLSARYDHRGMTYAALLAEKVSAPGK